MNAIIRGTPEAMGFVRSLGHDKHASRGRPLWEAWRTPEGVLLALPPSCGEVSLMPLHGPRGETLACIEPAGIFSFWPSLWKDPSLDEGRKR